MSEEVLRYLPIGVSDWSDINVPDTFFVDKTQKLLKLVSGKPNKIFLSRPRRMGKSTLVSMIEDLFTNGDKNFKGTAIYGHWPQEERYPVVTLNFMNVKCTPHSQQKAISTEFYITSFTKSLCKSLQKAFERAGFTEVPKFNNESPDLDSFLKDIEDITDEHRLVFLIDEWDHPLSQTIDNEPLFSATLSVLSTFYKWLRNLEAPRFILVTGIMRYHEASLFTGQDIQDISMDPYWGDLLGITQDELVTYYATYIEQAAQRLQLSQDELLAELKLYYDGFCFDEDAQVKLYCPYSLNKFFEPVSPKQGPNKVPKFDTFWMNSAGASHAVRRLLASRKIDLPQIQGLCDGKDVIITQDELSQPQYFSKVEILPLLTDTGYLSIKEVIPADQAPKKELSFRCGITNKEISKKFSKVVLDHINDKLNLQALTTEDSELREALRQALEQGDITKTCAKLNELLCSIAYDAFKDFHEASYRSAFAKWLREIFPEVREETYNYQGRSDLEVQTKQGRVYVFELKVCDCPMVASNNPEEEPAIDLQKIDTDVLIPAKKQILSRSYGVNAHTQGLPVTGVALAIGSTQRRIVAWRSISAAGESCAAVPRIDLTNKHIGTP